MSNKAPFAALGQASDVSSYVYKSNPACPLLLLCLVKLGMVVVVFMSQWELVDQFESGRWW